MRKKQKKMRKDDNLPNPAYNSCRRFGMLIAKPVKTGTLVFTGRRIPLSRTLAPEKTNFNLYFPQKKRILINHWRCARIGLRNLNWLYGMIDPMLFLAISACSQIPRIPIPLSTDSLTSVINLGGWRCQL